MTLEHETWDLTDADVREQARIACERAREQNVELKRGGGE